MKSIFLTIAAFLVSLLQNNSTGLVTVDSVDESKQTLGLNTAVVENTNLNSELSSIKVLTNTTEEGNWWEYPTDIKAATRSGNDLLVLVNKEYVLPSDYAPSDLVYASEAGIRKGESFQLRAIVINDLKSMVKVAESEGIDLSIVSGYRSYSTQVSTYKYWVSVNGGSTDEADKVSARAGHSQHQLGTAIDFSTSEIDDGLGGKFAYTKASAWLEENAWKYGFVMSYPSGYERFTGYSYESWHYRYIGIANAKEMHDSGLIEEIYLEGKNGVR